MKFWPILPLLMVGSACASNIKTTWGDNYGAGVWRGGVIEYPRGDTISARQTVKAKATRKARKLCGEGREPFLRPLAPFRKLEYKIGFFGTYLEQVWYEPYRYICADSDPMTEVYRFVLQPSARCEPIPDVFRLGSARFEAMQRAPSTDSCEAEGWLRFLDGVKRQYYFVGRKGLRTCEQLAFEANDKQVSGEDIDRWLRERLPASRQKHPHGRPTAGGDWFD